jgi:hypothetical protein
VINRRSSLRSYVIGMLVVRFPGRVVHLVVICVLLLWR